jgi:hypothetical protein
LAFCDVDATIVLHRAEALKQAAAGVSSSDTSIPDCLIARQTIRDEARKQVIAAKAAHESLVADLGRADGALQRAKRIVSIAATGVLIAEGAEQAIALKAAWNDAWRQYDWLSALADCRLHYAEASVPIMLPPDIESLLRNMASLDARIFADGRNDESAHAGEVWCRWFESLLTDAEAEVKLDGDEQAVGPTTEQSSQPASEIQVDLVPAIDPTTTTTEATMREAFAPTRSLSSVP